MPAQIRHETKDEKRAKTFASALKSGGFLFYLAYFVLNLDFLFAAAPSFYHRRQNCRQRHC